MRYTVFRYLPSFLTVLRYWVPPQCPPRLSLMQYSLSIFFGFGWRITTFIWWICTGKNSLHSSRVQECTLYFILFMLSFGAVISYYLLLFRPIATLQVAEIKNLLNFYSFPVALGQIYFVLVLISTTHNARYLYPEMDISRTAKCSVTFHCKRVMQNPSVGRKRQEQIKMKHKQLGWVVTYNKDAQIFKIVKNKIWLV